MRSKQQPTTMPCSRKGVVLFKDLFPEMVEKLGMRGFVEELRRGFHMLMDREKGVITAESLKKKMGLEGMMEDEEVMWMVREGDLDGDGALSEPEFFILMFRLSPGLMLHFFHLNKVYKK